MQHDKKVLVFVYGTLRKNNRNHRLLEHPGVKYICNDTIRAKMYTTHWAYPFLIFSQSNKDRVVGEIYEVPYSLVINSLDHLEGYQGPKSANNLYFRKKVITANKKIVYVYEAGNAIRKFQCDLITHGDWMKALADRQKGEVKAFIRVQQAEKWTDNGRIRQSSQEKRDQRETE